MKRKIIGDRKSNPAFYDMACRFPPPNITWTYGCPFRIGDKAVAHIQCLLWRQANPDRKLIILEDLNNSLSQGGRDVPADWVFAGIADEIWSAESVDDPMVNPNCEHLYNECLWHYWTKVRDNRPQVKTTIKPPPANLEKMETLLDKLNVDVDFITLNPLYDAPYNSFRNASPAWWQALVENLVKEMPVVLVGPKENASKMKCPAGAFPAWEHDLSVLDSLAMMYWGAAHVGGECGPTLWSPVLRKPTIGVYDGWTPWENWWTRPLNFDDTPVKIVKLGGRSNLVAKEIIEAVQAC
jgi:hypothetical protein